MNYMKQVAKMLGVELGEKFRIKNIGFNHFIKNDGVYFETITGVCSRDSTALTHLLTGDWEIEKLPWKPRTGDRYYYTDCYGSLDYDIWTNHPLDFASYKLGKIYRTKQEAEMHHEEDAKFWSEIREDLKQ